jgi:hypothetical protein
MVDGLILLHLLTRADGYVIAVRSLKNIIVCKITGQPVVLCGNGMKDEDHGESCDLSSLERQPEPRLDGPDESARFTPLNNFIRHNTCNNNTQQEVPSTLGVSISVSRMGARKYRVV